MSRFDNLPAWASTGDVLVGRNADFPVVYVDAEAAYDDILERLRDYHEAERAKEGDKPDWVQNGGFEVSQYWLEVAHQFIKLEVQVATRGFGQEIRIKDNAKKYAQSKWPEGRGTAAATRGREARQHFKAINGFIPS